VAFSVDSGEEANRFASSFWMSLMLAAMSSCKLKATRKVL
jgi:hypothetical protein